jgi:RNA polymerase sigma-70 factor (ECF subfamily)
MVAAEAYGLMLSSIESAGSVTDLTPLVETHAALVFRVAHSILRSQAEAEDVVQDVFVRVIEHQSDLSGVRDMRVWLARIAWDLALDRTRRVRPEQIDEQAAVLGKSESAVRALLFRARARLRERLAKGGRS